MENKDKYFYKYMKYKKKYLRKVKDLTGGGGKFDISISGQTTPNNKFKSARIIYHEGKYKIIISLDVQILGINALNYPLVLQNGKVYTVAKKNNNDVIVFKYKDDNQEKTIEFIVNGLLKERFSVKIGNKLINIIR